MAKKKYDESSIISILSDRDRVIERPTIYVPSTDTKGSVHIMFEIIDNAIDEVDADKQDTKKGDSVTTIFDEKTKQLTVIDNGRGMPLEKLYDICTVLNTTGKFDNNENTAYEFSGGLNGIGLKLAVFLSSECSVTSMRDGSSLTYKFEDGILVDEKREKSKKRGTVVSFRLNNKHIDIKNVTTDMIKDRLKEKAYLFPEINLRLIVLKNEKEIGNHLYKGKNISDRVMLFKPDTDIIRVQDNREVKLLDKYDDKKPKNKNVVIDVSFALSEKVLDSDQNDSIIAYGNNIKNYIGGSHVDGLKEGLIKYFRQNVLEKLNNKKSEDLQIIPSDIIAGLCGFVVIKVHKPDFRGQYKDQLMNQEVKYAVRDAVCDALEKEKPSIIKKYVDFVKMVAKGRIASKKTRKKDVANAYSKDKIHKYYPIIKSIYTTDPELIIVEGDSAADGAMAGADKYNQAIYSTSRPANLIDSPLSSVVKAKSAFNDIIDICGIELGKNCDVSKSNMKKIWLMSDADCDGDVIAISILGLIAKHCPDLIKHHMVGRIVPPAYSFKEGNKEIYVASQTEFFRRLIKRFSKEMHLYKLGRELDEDDTCRFLQANFKYKEKLDKLSERYSIDKKFMEFLVYNYKKDQPVSYWKKALKKFSDLRIDKEEGCILIDGSIGDEYIHIALDRYFDDSSLKFREQMKRNIMIYGYQINNDTGLSIYDVMLRFEKYRPKNITRYKGLGEMDPKELSELCLNRKNRITKIFKFSDLVNLDEDINKILIMLSGKQAYLAVRSEILMNKVADDMEIDT